MKRFALTLLLWGLMAALTSQAIAQILTPKPPPAPRINGARVFGARPGRPFLFTIPATGEEPITYTAEGLPEGLTLDAKQGRITGAVSKTGEYRVRLTATNALGKDSKTLRIKIGDQICLTPPMGWNSWNCFAGAVTQQQVRAQADAMVKSGLIKHGWSYINIDDTWQGERGGKYNALQGNAKFPDMKALCAEIHSLGLKAGIYSTPWVTSYAGYPGGSAENAEGKWTKFKGTKQVNKKILPWAVGPFSFAKQDAHQWADWGFDYLKYDWNPIETPQVEEIGVALKESGRDVVLSLSNHAPIAGAADWAKLSNCWRTTGDIRDNWRSVTSIGFTQDAWKGFAGPGHWNDPDMLVVGMVGWGPKLHPTGLTPDEQYTHISLWCLLAAPLLIGCDMTQMDDFTLSLLSNDEVLAIDQDPLGKEAWRAKEDKEAGIEIWTRPLSDGTVAVGLFNRGRYEVEPPRRPRKGEQAPAPVWKLRDRATGKAVDLASEAEAQAELQKSAGSVEITADWADLHLSGPQPVRDLWRQQDLGRSDGKVTAKVAFHGAMLLKIGTPHAEEAIASVHAGEEVVPPSAAPAPRYWSVALADSIMQRYPDFSKAYWRPWTYVNGYVLYGFEMLYRSTGDRRYFDFMQRYIDPFLDEAGNLRGISLNNLDNMMTGNILVGLYEATHETRYKVAAGQIRKAFDDYPRNSDGGFWHARSLKGQMWIDGVFMGQMFLIRYGKSIGDSDYCFDEAVKQITVFAKHGLKGDTGLYYHAWSEQPAKWADPQTGLSPEVWSEGLGWYALVVAETLAVLPRNHPKRAEVENIFLRLAAGLKRTQDAKSGRWFQVVDKGDQPDNWTDTSDSAMFTYALQRGIELGLLTKKEFAPVVARGYRGILANARVDAEGLVDIYSSCDGVGVQVDYAHYIHYPQKVNAKEAVGGFLWATAIVEKPGKKAVPALISR